VAKVDADLELSNMMYAKLKEREKKKVFELEKVMEKLKASARHWRSGRPRLRLLNQVCSSFEESKSFEFDGRLDVLVVAKVF